MLEITPGGRRKHERSAGSDASPFADTTDPEGVVFLKMRGVAAGEGRGILFQEHSRHAEAGVVAALIVKFDDAAFGRDAPPAAPLSEKR